MKILFISNQFPYPLNVGSKIRAFNLLKAYSRKHRVTLVCFYRDEAELKYLPELKKYCEDIYAISTKGCAFNRLKKINRFSRLFRTIFSKIPNSISGYSSREAMDLIKKLSQNDYDLWHLQTAHSFNNIENLLNIKNRKFKLVLNLNDYESIKLKRELDLTKFSFNKVLSIIEYFKWKMFEKTMFHKFDLCLACSGLEKDALVKNGINALVVPNGVNSDSGTFPRSQNNGSDLLYLGAMDYEPNNDAVLYFCKEIFPAIKKAVPSARFIIAGKDPFEEVLRLNNGIDVIVKGYVENVIAAFDECSIFVVPLRVGGGTRIKILEAMARGKAVVSTSIGCEGIDVTDQKDITIADNPADFAKKCIELLRDHDKRRDLGENGKKLVSEKYMWDSIGTEFMAVIDSLLAANKDKEGCRCQK